MDGDGHKLELREPRPIRFRHRKGYSYADCWIANSLSVKAEKIWDILAQINVKGRESQGVIEPSEFERERDKLTERLKTITDPNGRRMETYAYEPEELYPVSVGDRPDLMVYFDDLYWRSAGTLGHSDIYLSEDDMGLDDAVHSQPRTFILHDR